MKNFVIVLSIGGFIVMLALVGPQLGRWGAAFSNDTHDGYVEHYPLTTKDKAARAEALAAVVRREESGRRMSQRTKLIELSATKREPHPITLKPGETLLLVSEWSGLSVAKIRSENKLKSWDIPTVGRRLRITMNGGQTERFVVRRSEFSASREARFAETWKLKHMQDYRVRGGDTTSRIIERFGAPLAPWLVKKYNPALNLSVLPKDKVLAIPIFRRRPKAKDAPRDDIVFATESYLFLNIDARLGESLGLYSRWSGTSVETIKDDNGLRRDQINLGQSINVRVFHKRVAPFETAREQYRKDAVQRLQGLFFLEHTLKSSETVWALASRYAVDYQQLKDYNSDKDFRRLSPGIRIRIPRTDAPYSELQEKMNRMK
jgi:LysM repeat protein